MSTFVVRQAMPDDAEAFSECHIACWREAYGSLWGPERLAGLDAARLAERRRQEIEAGTAVHFMAETTPETGTPEVFGIAIAGPARDTDAPAPTELYAIYVRHAHQGSGVAEDLLRAAIGDKPASLWVYRDNPRASAFYVHHDFIPDGEERPDAEGIMEIRMVRR
jgi:GNAT superfamily N-acetyltransferase